jgi:hypothetical protein
LESRVRVQERLFFAVGYGATRRVEPPESLDMAARTRSTFLRAQRVQSLFQESFSLIPLSSWLPQLKQDTPRRYKQVVQFLDRLLKPGRHAFTGEQERGGDYQFEHGDRPAFPPALADESDPNHIPSVAPHAVCPDIA